MPTTLPAQQLEFGSLMFPERTVLYVSEVAGKLRVTEQHVIDLIEEGALQAVSVGGEFDSVRVPRAWLEALWQERGRPPAELWPHLSRAKAASAKTRKTWRIPVEGWEAFLERRHSFRI